MSVKIPIKPVGALFSFTIELEGVTYALTFRWNDRDEAWFMDIGDGAGADIITGIRVVIRQGLLGRAASSLLPPGEIMAFDTSDTNVEATFEDFGLRVQLVYLTAADLSA